MSETMPPDGVPDMTAAELALGLLDGEERAAALRRMLSDRDFAAEVERWRGYLAQLFDFFPEAAAPDAVLPRIERSLDTSGAASASASRGWLWPSIAGLTSIAAAALLVVVVNRPPPAPPLAPRPAPVAPAGPLLAATIAPVGKGAPVTAVYDPEAGQLRLTVAALADAKRSQELWVIAGDGVPHSLGLLGTGGGSTLAVAADNRARLAAGAVLAVSLEPLGGSPTGLPTGPVVAKGALSQV